MNKKFVKENKQVLREFIGKLLVKLFSNRSKRELDKMIEKDPVLKKRKDDIEKLGKDISIRIDKLEKDYPDIAAKFRKAYS